MHPDGLYREVPVISTGKSGKQQMRNAPPLQRRTRAHTKPPKQRPIARL